MEGTVVDQSAVEEALTGGKVAGGATVTGVVHLAGFKYAGVSVQRPLHTYEQNVTGMQVLLGRMRDLGVKNLVFSSSAATFGTPDVDLVTEQTPTHPESPYGESKLVGEWLIRDVARISGAAAHVPALLQRRRFRLRRPVRHQPAQPVPARAQGPHRGRDAGRSSAPTTRPRTAPASATTSTSRTSPSHTSAAAARLERGEPLEPVYNLGSGTGVSVLQIMDAVRRVTGIDFEPSLEPRRPGDPARIVASGELAGRDLDWRMRHDLDDMVASAWRAWQQARAASSR